MSSGGCHVHVTMIKRPQIENQYRIAYIQSIVTLTDAKSRGWTCRIQLELYIVELRIKL